MESNVTQRHKNLQGISAESRMCFQELSQQMTDSFPSGQLRLLRSLKPQHVATHLHQQQMGSHHSQHTLPRVLPQ